MSEQEQSLNVGDRVEVRTPLGLLDGEGVLTEINPDNPSGFIYEVLFDDEEFSLPFQANEVHKA